MKKTIVIIGAGPGVGFGALKPLAMGGYQLLRCN